jgi:hypothetical protein
MEDKKMTTLLKLPTKVKHRSNTRPKSLILPIPAAVRDIMELEHNSDITLEVCLENDQKVLQIQKIG